MTNPVDALRRLSGKHRQRVATAIEKAEKMKKVADAAIKAASEAKSEGA